MRELITQQSLPTEHLLMRELSHRVNNEFASAASIIFRAASRCDSHDAKAVLTSVGEELHRYALVHRALQMPEHGTRIDAAMYLQRLCLCIARSKLDSNDIKLVLMARPLLMQSERCWRLGMIVYELITNAARHAFHGMGGEISVEFWPLGSFVGCRVSDNGAGPKDIRKGNGLDIVCELAKSLDGRFEQSFGPQGSMSILVIPM
jgi:two-component sensor histidine kinase